MGAALAVENGRSGRPRAPVPPSLSRASKVVDVRREGVGARTTAQKFRLDAGSWVWGGGGGGGDASPSRVRKFGV